MGACDQRRGKPQRKRCNAQAQSLCLAPAQTPATKMQRARTITLNDTGASPDGGYAAHSTCAVHTWYLIKQRTNTLQLRRKANS